MIELNGIMLYHRETQRIFDLHSTTLMPFSSMCCVNLPHTRVFCTRLHIFMYIYTYTAAAAAAAMLFIHNTSLKLTEIDTAMHKYNILFASTSSAHICNEQFRPNKWLNTFA